MYCTRRKLSVLGKKQASEWSQEQDLLKMDIFPTHRVKGTQYGQIQTTKYAFKEERPKGH